MGRTIVERASILPRGVFFAVGVGVAFGLGIVVAGGMGEAHGHEQDGAAALDDALTRAELRAKAYDDKRAQMKLTYATELQRADVEHVEKLPASSHAPSSPEPAAAPLEAAPPPMPPTAAAPASSGGAPLASGAAKPAHGGDDDDDDDVADAPAAPAERIDDKRIREALAKVLGPSAPAAVADPAPAKASAAKTYTLQVASAPSRTGAEAMAQKIGQGAHVVEGEVGGKAVFRVRLGSYTDRGAAEAAKAKLTMPSFIVAE